MSGPPHRAERRAPEVGAHRIPPLLQPRQATSHARTPDARTEGALNDRSDPVAAGVERAPSRLRTRRLNTTDVLPPHTPTIGRSGSSRGTVRSTSRAARSSQVITITLSPTRKSRMPSAMRGSKTSHAGGAPSSPCLGAWACSTSGDSTHPIGTTSKRFIADADIGPGALSSRSPRSHPAEGGRSRRPSSGRVEFVEGAISRAERPGHDCQKDDGSGRDEVRRVRSVIADGSMGHKCTGHIEENARIAVLC